MKVPESYYDEIFNFRGQWDMPSACGLKIIKKECKVYVIATELYRDNPGTTVAEAGKKLLIQICEAMNLKLSDVIYLQCNPDTNSKLSFYNEEYFETCFSEDGRAVFRRLDAEEIKSIFD